MKHKPIISIYWQGVTYKFNRSGYPLYNVLEKHDYYLKNQSYDR